MFIGFFIWNKFNLVLIQKFHMLIDFQHLLIKKTLEAGPGDILQYVESGE